MKDLMKLVNQVVEDFVAMKIRFQTVGSWTVGTKMGSCWGRCYQRGKGIYDIEISEKLLQDNIEDQYIKDTIAHELLHTVEGCCNHGWYWHKLADIVNTRMPQYHITRTTSREDKGIYVYYRYFFKCETCGKVVKRQKKSKFTENYRNYRCSACGGKFEKTAPPEEALAATR